MKLPLPRLTKKSLTIISTLAIIGLVYAYYFFVFVAQNKRHYNEKSYRTLSKISENIHDKYANLKKGTQSITKRVAYEIFNEEPNPVADSLENVLDILEREIGDIEMKIYMEDGNVNTSLSTGYIDEAYARIDSMSVVYLDAYYELYDKLDPTYRFKERIKNRLSAYHLDLEFAYSANFLTSLGLLGFDVLDEHYDYTGIDIRYHLDFEKFMKPLMRPERFQEFFIVDTESEDIIFQTFDSRITMSDLNMIYPDSSGIRVTNAILFQNNEITYKGFVHNMRSVNDKNWLVVGVVTASNYAAQTKQIDGWVILYTSLTVVFIIIIMPLLKLHLMNEVERLHLGNVTLTWASIALGTPIIILGILVLTFYKGHDAINRDLQLVQLTTNIQEDFVAEVEAVYAQLSSFDDSLSTNRKAVKFLQDSSQKYLDRAIFDESQYRYFNEMFWTNNQGVQKLMMNGQEGSKLSRNNALLQIDLSNRAYFSHVRDGDMWINESQQPYYLQSIVSWTTGLNELAIAKPSKSRRYKVAAITAKITSVIDAVMPLGYGFAIIDKAGQVIFHSDKKKNLQENFLQETNQNKTLASSLYGQNAFHFTANYYNKAHRMYVQPIPNMPLYLVSFADESLMKSRVAETWILALYFIVLSFLGGLIILIYIAACQYKNSNLKTKRFFLDWLKPVTKNKNMYPRLALANLLVLVCTLGFNLLLFQEALEELLTVMILPMLLLGIVYIVLTSQLAKCTQNRLFWVAAVTLLICNAFAIGYFDASFAFVGFQAIVIVIYYWCTTSRYFDPFFDQLPHAFVWFLFTWLLTSSVLPVLYYYKVAYRIESQIWTKHNLLDFSNQLLSKKAQLKTQISNSNRLNASEQDLYINNKMKSGNYSDVISFESLIPPTTTKENDGFQSLLHAIRPTFNELVTNNRGLIFNQNKDEKRKWIYGKHHLIDGDTILIAPHRVGLEYAHRADKQSFSATIGHISFLTLMSNPPIYLILLIAIVVFCYLLYFILKFASNKVYAIEDRFQNQRITIEHEQILTLLKASHNVILVGLANSGKTRLLKAAFDKKNPISSINCMMINQGENWTMEQSKWVTSKSAAVLLYNFEYQLNDHDANVNKLRLLERLFAAGKKVIISTEIHPLAIADNYYDLLKVTEERGLRSAYLKDLKIWRHIFGSFVDIYRPLKDQYETETVQKEPNIIDAELRYGSYLHDIRPLITDKLSDRMQKEENIILEIQDYAKSYYFALWNSISKVERYIIYDLAKDGYVNIKNEKAIVELLKKGILLYDDDGLRVMNKSFTNFVLEAVKPEEALAMEKEERQQGKWSNVSTVLILLVLGMVVLIALGQPDFFNNINAIMAAVAGATGMLSKVDGLFSTGRKWRV